MHLLEVDSFFLQATCQHLQLIVSGVQVAAGFQTKGAGELGLHLNFLFSVHQRHRRGFWRADDQLLAAWKNEMDEVMMNPLCWHQGSGQLQPVPEKLLLVLPERVQLLTVARHPWLLADGQQQWKYCQMQSWVGPGLDLQVQRHPGQPKEEPCLWWR